MAQKEKVVTVDPTAPTTSPDAPKASTKGKQGKKSAPVLFLADDTALPDGMEIASFEVRETEKDADGKEKLDDAGEKIVKITVLQVRTTIRGNAAGIVAAQKEQNEAAKNDKAGNLYVSDSMRNNAVGYVTAMFKAGKITAEQSKNVVPLASKARVISKAAKAGKLATALAADSSKTIEQKMEEFRLMLLAQ